MIPLFFSLIIATTSLGEKIFQNECNGKKERLVWWNQGENFASFGIGHFIWYPEGVKEPFVETFPLLLAHLRSVGLSIPEWVEETKGCPWKTREAFLDPAQKQKRDELRAFLESTIAEQASFIEKRFQEALDRIIAMLSESEKVQTQERIDILLATAEGRFAMIDYCNFKGDGTNAEERYHEKGWGLMQVLLLMPAESKEPLIAFVATAKTVLQQRVENSPPERNEKKWLTGWLARIDRY